MEFTKEIEASYEKILKLPDVQLLASLHAIELHRKEPHMIVILATLILMVEKSLSSAPDDKGREWLRTKLLEALTPK